MYGVPQGLSKLRAGLTGNKTIGFMNFQIKGIYSEETKHGDAILFGTGGSAAFFKGDHLHVTKVSDKDGGVFKYRTGLKEDHIKYNRYLSAEEKARYTKELVKVTKKLQEAFGPEVLQDDNAFFWKRSGKLTITNETENMLYDDEDPNALLLKWMIIGGGFDLVAPSLKAAKDNNVQFYITDVASEAERTYERRGSKPEAFGLYYELKKKHNTDALVYISWLLGDKTKGFTKKTAPHTLFQCIEDYIEGEHVKVGKKACAARFIEVVEKWEKDKEQLIAESSIAAADYYNFLYMKDEDGHFYFVDTDTRLGKTIQETAKLLLEPKHRELLLLIKDKVDKELNR